MAIKIERGMKAVKAGALAVSEAFGIGADVLEKKRKELLRESAG
jgi:hypothetical protein